MGIYAYADHIFPCPGDVLSISTWKPGTSHSCLFPEASLSCNTRKTQPRSSCPSPAYWGSPSSVTSTSTTFSQCDWIWCWFGSLHLTFDPKERLKMYLCSKATAPKSSALSLLTSVLMPRLDAMAPSVSKQHSWAGSSPPGYCIIINKDRVACILNRVEKLWLLTEIFWS